MYHIHHKYHKSYSVYIICIVCMPPHLRTAGFVAERLAAAVIGKAAIAVAIAVAVARSS